MSPLLPPGSPPRVTRRRDPRSLPRLDHLVAVVPVGASRAIWEEVPGGVALAAASRRRGGGKAGTVLTLHLQDPCPVSVGFADREGSPHAWLTLGRKLAAETLAGRPARVGVLSAGAPEADARGWLEAVVAALLAGDADMPRFSSQDEAQSRSRLSAVTVLDEAVVLDAARVRAEAEGNHLARWLTALPPNRLDATGYREVLEALAQREGWEFEFLDESALAERGAGAFLAVARSNPRRDAGIARLRYRPGESGDRAVLALVGKGICFDTGGTNLKPFRSMLDMHEDMQGSAVALGSLLALSRIGFPRPVDCWLGITENRIGPDAYKSRDVVTAANGTTIEVIHTDAEGRMVLADVLALAGRESPQLIVDYATLTGACVAALTNRYSGVFSNRGQVAQLAVAAGQACGERVWSFPMDADYDEAIESKVADVLQCAVDNDGDHILAARFLQRFVPAESAWLHVDLAAGHRKGGLGHVATPQTGFGVRLTLAMLLDQGLLERTGPESTA